MSRSDKARKTWEESTAATGTEGGSSSSGTRKERDKTEENDGEMEENDGGDERPEWDREG